MAKIAASITGTTPLLCNRFGDDREMEATSGTRSSIVGDRGTAREQAERKLYLDEAGVPHIPMPNLFRAFIDGGKFFKAGRSKVTTQKSSLIPAYLDLLGVTYPIQSDEPWTVDTRPVRIPSTGGRILCHRPMFPEGWTLDFEADLDVSGIGVALFREIVDATGKRIGLGDYRPDTKGPFGKFVVTSWTVDKEE